MSSPPSGTSSWGRALLSQGKRCHPSLLWPSCSGCSGQLCAGCLGRRAMLGPAEGCCARRTVPTQSRSPAKSTAKCRSLQREGGISSKPGHFFLVLEHCQLPPGLGPAGMWLQTPRGRHFTAHAGNETKNLFTRATSQWAVTSLLRATAGCAVRMGCHHQLLLRSRDAEMEGFLGAVVLI